MTNVGEMRRAIIVTLLFIAGLALLMQWDGFPAWLAQFRVDR